ncbi:MAG: divergent polysaccharide deacetylase family protein [bacterium]|nr:MAG: divergent polysaccharide deacetylase family protein [bacterium]
MARKKKKKVRQPTSLAILLVVLLIVAIALFRFLKTEKGWVFLLDAGIDGKYELVQQTLEGRLVDGLERAGIPRSDIQVDRKSATAGGEPTVFRVSVSADRSLIKIHSEIDRAVRSSGGRIRSCSESSGGKAIVMEVGTKRRTTQRCIIRKSRKAERPDRAENGSPTVAIIVDDFGYFYNSLVREFLSLDVPLTVSVIPGLKYSKRICEEARKKGKVVLCHLPMEPQAGADDVGDIPLVRVDMKHQEIEKVVERALDTTPGVVGINNHMGSKATADRDAMRAVLSVCRRRDLFFIDSMTTPYSVVGEVAHEIGVRTTSNDLFIDNSEEEIRERMQKILSIATRKGRAVGILHVRRKTLEHFKWMIRAAQDTGVRFQTTAEVIEELTVAQKEGDRW